MAAPYPQVVLFGDSLFERAPDLQDGFAFQAALQSHCIRRYDVINRGFSGYNTSQALKALPAIFPPPSPSGPKIKYLLILLGANDAALQMEVDNQHVDLDKFKINLTQIVTHENIRAHNPSILLITPPPLDGIRIAQVDGEAGKPYPMREAKISAAYADAAREVAGSTGVTLVDLWKALMDYAVARTPGFDASAGLLGDPSSGQRGYLKQLLPDGLHMSGEAYHVLFDAVLPYIKPEHPNLSFEGWAFPEWRTAPWL